MDPIPSAPTVAAETLTYEIVDATDSAAKKVHLVLGGSSYTATGKLCRIMKSINGVTSPPAALNFAEIRTCPGGDTGSPNMCVRSCSNDKNTIDYEELSPRTKYIYVNSGNSNGDVNTVEKKKGGQVFGFAIPLLVDPQILISTDSTSNKLTLAAKTCIPVDCPIYYGNAKYVPGSKGESCIDNNSENSVDFDLLIPHYEMRCINYPSFYYIMPNEYMKKTISIYEPQYYVTKLTGNAKIKINFLESPSHEICIFSVKDATVDDSTYTSTCGNTARKCYAPCKDVELTIDATKTIFNVLIQTRHHDTSKTATPFDGYAQDKFAIVEPGTKFLSEHSSVGATVDLTAFTNSSPTPSFASCTLTHYLAGQIRTISTNKPQCKGTSDTTDIECPTTCTKATIKGLEAGKTYIVEVASTGITKPATFKEKIFIRTAKASGKNYGTTAPTKTASEIIVKSVAGELPADSKEEPTCEYYISLAGKDHFSPAICSDGFACRGFCKESKTIKSLEPNTAYDIKVVSQKDYDIHLYKGIVTGLDKLNITYKFTLHGFKLNAQLSADIPDALCHYEVTVKKNDQYALAYRCPRPPIATRVPANNAAPSTGAEVKTAGLLEDIAVKTISEAGKKALNDATASLTPSLGTATPNSNATPNTPATNAANLLVCQQIPLCSSIEFTQFYRADGEYRVLVIAEGKSSPGYIDIPTNIPPKNPTDLKKLMKVYINRDGNSLDVESVLPTGLDEHSLCKWELRNSTLRSKGVLKSCMELNSADCTAFPTCSSFKITDVIDDNDYHLTVYYSEDVNIFGVAEIKHGARSSKGLIVSGAVGVLLAAVAMYYVFWRNQEKVVED